MPIQDEVPLIARTHEPSLSPWRFRRSRGARGGAALLGAMLLVGCARAPLNIDNTEWELVRWHERPMASDATTKALDLRIEQRQVLGYSGCNHYSGPYKVSHGRFSSGPLITTRAGCLSAGAHALEQAFLTALEDGGRLVLTDPARLRIEPASGEVLEFRRR